MTDMRNTHGPDTLVWDWFWTKTSSVQLAVKCLATCLLLIV